MILQFLLMAIGAVCMYAWGYSCGQAESEEEIRKALNEMRFWRDICNRQKKQIELMPKPGTAEWELKARAKPPVKYCEHSGAELR